MPRETFKRKNPMKISLFRTSIVLLFLAGLTAACGGGATTSTPATSGSQSVNVTVSILPEKYFVERIGGNHVSVNVMVGPGDSPHTYEPKVDQMTSLSNSALYFSIGVDFEGAWMGRIASANPNMKIVDVSANINKIPMTVASEGEKAGNPDPHVWTAPENVKIIAQSIYQALAEVDPANQADYQANLAAFQKDIDALQRDIQTSLSSITINKFLVFHPAWGYFAHEFGLEQIAIEIGGVEPSAKELVAIIDEAKKDNIKVVFGSPEFSTKTADYIAQEINGQVVLIDPLAEDWLTNLQNVANAFAQALNN
jgi:zinc transport system substrate-binding protein